MGDVEKEDVLYVNLRMTTGKINESRDLKVTANTKVFLAIMKVI